MVRVGRNGRLPAQPWRRAAVMLLVVPAVIGNGGCAPSSQDDHEAVVARYEEYWSAVQRVTSSSTMDLDELSDTARGTQLRSLTENWAASRAEVVVSVGSVRSDVTEVSIRGDRAYLIDRLDLSGWLLADADTGGAFEGQFVNPSCEIYEVVLARDSGRWYVTEISDLGQCDDSN